MLNKKNKKSKDNLSSKSSGKLEARNFTKVPKDKAKRKWKMQPQKQKQDQVFFEFLICKKQTAKQMFLDFSVLQNKSFKKTKNNYPNPSQNETEFQA